jgi:two-component SAPR family response regulator
MSKDDINIYKKRHIVENYFAWIDSKIPRMAKIYDKKINNYVSMLYMSTSDLILGRIKAGLKIK